MDKKKAKRTVKRTFQQVINCGPPVDLIVSYLGYLNPGCSHRGSDAFTLTCSQIWKLKGTKRKKCRFHPNIWNGKICLTHCRNIKRMLRHRDLNSWLYGSLPVNYIHMQSRGMSRELRLKQCKFIRNFFVVEQICCGGLGFQPRGLKSVHLLKTLKYPLSTCLSKRKRILKKMVQRITKKEF